MNNDFGNDYITLTDDNGEEVELEHIYTAEYNNETYMAFLPTNVSEDDDEYGLIILKVSEEDDEEYLVSVDDEDELDAVHEYIIQAIADEEDESGLENDEEFEEDDEEDDE